jgi:hypothetical protein
MVGYPLLMSEADSDAVAAAYHEAGHAVAAFLYGREFADVSIVSDDDLSGPCGVTEAFEHVLSLVDEGWDTPSDLASVRNGLVVVLAGLSAEERLSGEPVASGDEYDSQMAERMVEALPSDGSASVDEYLDAARAAADRLWDRPRAWTAVRAIADALIQDRTLTFEEVVSLIRRVSPDLQPLDLPEERERWVWDDRDGWVRHGGLVE